MKLLTKLLPFALATLFLTSCSDDDNGGNEPETPVTIQAFVDSSPNYSLLKAALKATNLNAVLDDNSTQFTVFAPNNTAFSAFLTEKGFTNGLSDVDTDEELSLVKNILLNHVIIGDEFKANAILSSAPNYLINAAEGPKDLADNTTNLSTYYSIIEGEVKINGIVTVTTPDAYDATNGIIHAVDKVIDLPKISTFVTSNSSLSSLTSSLISAKLVETVDNLNPATVFAPTDDAFNKLNKLPEDDALANVLTYHVIASLNIVASDVVSRIDEETPATVQGQKLDIVAGPAIKGKANANASALVTTDIQAINGTIHIIDTVLIPAEEAKKMEVVEKI